jgi:integrase
LFESILLFFTCALASLYFFDWLVKDSGAVSESKRPDMKFLYWGFAEELFPILPRVLPPNSEMEVMPDNFLDHLLQRPAGWRLLEKTEVAGMRLDAICQDDVGALTFSGGPSNRNNALRTLRRMLGKAEEWGVLKAVPRIKLGQEHQRERIIDERIEAQLLPFCKQPLRDVLMIMRDTGLRNQKEVFAMRWEYVDWVNSRYFVYDSKTPKGRRHVPISPRVKDALLRRYSGQKGGWVFPAKRAQCGHLTTVARQFQKARQDAGLPNDLVLYCARHGFGTEMYRATKNLFAVMKVMGHSAVTTTMKYHHHDIDEIAQVASQRVQ